MAIINLSSRHNLKLNATIKPAPIYSVTYSCRLGSRVIINFGFLCVLHSHLCTVVHVTRGNCMCCGSLKHLYKSEGTAKIL